MAEFLEEEGLSVEKLEEDDEKECVHGKQTRHHFIWNATNRAILVVSASGVCITDNGVYERVPGAEAGAGEPGVE
jgi:hypothetical protein